MKPPTSGSLRRSEADTSTWRQPPDLLRTRTVVAGRAARPVTTRARWSSAMAWSSAWTKSRAWTPDELVGVPPEQLGDRRAHPQQREVLVDDGGDLEAVLHQGPEATLAGRQRLLGDDPVGDVAEVGDDPVHLGDVEVVLERRLEPVPHVAGVADAQLEADATRSGSARAASHASEEVLDVVAVDRRGDVEPDAVVGVHAEGTHQGRAGEAAATLLVEQQHAVGRVLHQGLPARLAGEEGVLGRAPGR